MWEVECPLGCTVGTAGDVDGNGYADFAIGEPTRETVRVYYGSASGPQGGFWMETGVEGSWFGSAVLAAGDLNGDGFGDLAVGSPDEDGSAGRVRVYRGSMSGPSHDAPWVFGAGGQAGQQFGTAVGTAGDVNGDGYADLLITAPFYDTAGEADAGRAHVYYGSASGPASTPAWTVEGVGSSRYYGRAATTAGDVNGDGFSDVIVGAPGSESVPGAVYAYHGGPAGLGPNSGWTKEGGLAGAYFGYSVAPAGDVNGDGYGDVIIGAVYYDDGQTREGKAFVFNGSATGLPFLPNWTATSDQAEARMGYSVSSAGDVNGDGYDDVLVGCRGYSNPESDEGAAFVWYGSDRGLGPFGTPANADWSAEANQVDAYFGISVSTAGDINGDGYGDIIVGASLYDDGQTDEGAAFVWHGHPAGLGKGGTPSNADWAATGNQVSSRFGAAVASAGDVNGDGFGDVLVGAYLYDAPEANEGMAFAWYGSPAGLGADGAPTNADWSAESDQAGASFGFALASAGDVNGDARSDVVVGAYLYDLPSLADCGRVTVFHGLPSGIAGSPAFTAYGGGVDDRAGQSVRSAGDVNGDGYADIVYGAPNWDGVGKLKCGRAFVDYGGAGGISTGGSWVAEGAAADDGFGTSVAGVGDIDGDGYADVLIGAPYRDNPESAEGAVGLFYGNEGRSRLSKPGQYDGGPDAGIIPRYGRSNDDYYVRLTGRAYGLIGPAAFSTESEVKSAGVPFDGTGIRRGSATFLTSLAGTDFTDLRLVKSGLQHWRVRARYTASTSPFQSHGRWYHPVWDGWNAGSFRTRQDPDGDNVPTERDNCPADANPAQEDADGDGRGDACDVCTDTDGDGYGDPGYPVNTCEQDNCPALPNPEQADADRDDTGDACDACIDTDRDGFGDPGFPGDSCPDDNCWGHANPGQEDGDADGIGNVCDNCPTNANPNQEDFDHDGAGDLCDLCTDTDGDGYGNPGFPRSICPGDNCPDVPSADRTDTDRDGSGDVCDDCTDQDLDGFGMPPAQLQTCQLDNCYRAYNPGQEDADTDGSGDVCDKCTDTDSDGWGTPGFPVNTCAEDCRPDDNTIWSAPTPIDSLMLTRAPTGNLTWSPPSNPGATTIQYDAMSSRKSDDWSIFEAMCILSDTTALTATEPSLPPPGQAYYYLVRAEGPCGSTMGTRSDGTPRIGRACP
ncbi:MAG: FG-GAP-like repeat-containing protein [Acidobacteria bacterium]|nr:FG-GAP-like repeat-containing protein [Acidobacteriota bacterium]